MRWVSYIPLLLLLAVPARAAGEASIAGVVRDSNGHALADVDVQVQSESTGARWKTRSDDDGRFAVAGIAAGRYKATVRMPGFRTIARVGVEVGADRDVALDFAMELLGLHEVITVVSGNDALDRSNGDSLTLTRDGPGAAQLDASLRREFPLYRGMSLEVGLNVFNVLNHPAFADPAPFLSSPFFGQSTSMQNLMLGAGGPNTGSPPLFQTGGARSVEFSFRLSHRDSRLRADRYRSSSC